METHANPGQHWLFGSKGIQFSPTFFSVHTEGELDGISEGEANGDSLGDSEGTPDGLNAGCEGTPDGASEGEANGDSLGDADGRAVPALVGDAVTVGFFVGVGAVVVGLGVGAPTSWGVGLWQYGLK